MGSAYRRENDPVVMVKQLAVNHNSGQEPKPHEDQRKSRESPADCDDQGSFVVCHFWRLQNGELGVRTNGEIGRRRVSLGLLNKALAFHCQTGRLTSL